MPRTIIDIPDAQLRDVDQLCRLLKISRAEAVRRGLHEFIAQNQSVRTEGFGLWKNDVPHPAKLLERLRGRW
jgi:metal-responsive CopG/Arc/MetJ family transcriptional regulator